MVANHYRLMDYQFLRPYWLYLSAVPDLSHVRMLMGQIHLVGDPRVVPTSLLLRRTVVSEWASHIGMNFFRARDFPFFRA